MPVAVSLRFDDDVADMLRERAELERRSINRLVNDVLRQYLEPAEPERVRSLVIGLGNHLAVARSAIKPLEHQETQKDFNDKIRGALEALTDCVELLSMAMEPEKVPVVSRMPREKIPV